MTAIDDYLANVEPAKRKALERIRTLAKKAVPDAVETIGYGMPTLKYRGKPFLGFAARANYIGVYPYSGHVIEALCDELRAYKTTKGAIHVPLETPIPERTLRAIIGARLKAIAASSS
ncbi:MAG TPA: DUF1801 domain-containing protein [Candidatus Acidoferrales bacterium]|jgi:uncharacterized protein YdhG (YjbR/CyaY superfamily)|nr:DUF1801 domain-containing protein [Candidatus Acidoferrales bacterium]